MKEMEHHSYYAYDNIIQWYLNKKDKAFILEVITDQWEDCDSNETWLCSFNYLQIKFNDISIIIKETDEQLYVLYTNDTNDIEYNDIKELEAIKILEKLTTAINREKQINSILED